MSLNQTPSSDRIHIGIFGRRNAGKSSLINAITNQNIAIVSDVLGTTTDPVYKAMELLPLGPVMIIDTPGLDDEGTLGLMRIEKTKQVINKTDLAIIVVDSETGKTHIENEIIALLSEKNIPYIIVFNKSDIVKPQSLSDGEIAVSSLNGENINELKEMIAKKATIETHKYPIISDLINKGDTIILVVPIDEAAPKGRIILPQQQTLREILDKNATAYICQPQQLKETLSKLKEPPKMVITDSQAFSAVSQIVPEDILLTSFSILFARHKGELDSQFSGISALDKLCPGDRVMIAEGCTHHRQCNDIGTVKIPHMLESYAGGKLDFYFTSGTQFPEDLSSFKLIVHCGGCMLNEREMKHRLSTAKNQNIPITNYGMTIAKITGILDRSLKVFK